MKYVIYLRVSKKDGDIRTQELAILKHLKSIDQSDFKYVIFFDEKSAYTKTIDKREGMKQALDALDSGDIFVAVKADRISRVTQEVLIFVEQLNKKNAEIILIDQPGIKDKFFLTIYAAIAEKESETMSKRVRAKFDAKKQRGEKLGGSPPYGWMVDPKGFLTVQKEGKTVQVAGTLIPHPKEREALMLMLAMESAGLSYRRMASILVDRRMWNRARKPFQGASVYRILQRVDRSIFQSPSLEAPEVQSLLCNK